MENNSLLKMDFIIIVGIILVLLIFLVSIVFMLKNLSGSSSASIAGVQTSEKQYTITNISITKIPTSGQINYGFEL